MRASAPLAAMIIAAIFVPGCASGPPVGIGLAEAISNPKAHENKKVELTGPVIEYEPVEGDAYRTLRFALGSGPERKISVYASGYTAEAITKASALVGRAFETGELITVIGTLRMARADEEADEEKAPRAELRLESVECRGEKIAVARGAKTVPGFEVGGWHITPSIGINATFSP